VGVRLEKGRGGTVGELKERDKYALKLTMEKREILYRMRLSGETYSCGRKPSGLLKGMTGT